MASKKPRLQFTEDSGSTADSRMRKPAQPKLLTDEQKAKARKEQLRFGKKENTATVDMDSRKSGFRNGVVKYDIPVQKKKGLSQNTDRISECFTSCFCLP